MRKFIPSYFLSLIVLLSLSACDPVNIKIVKVTIPVFSQTNQNTLVGDNLLENVLVDIDKIAAKHKMPIKDLLNTDDPLLLRHYSAMDETNPLAAQGSTDLFISKSEDSSYLELGYYDFPSTSPSQLTQNLEKDLKEILTVKYRLTYTEQKR